MGICVPMYTCGHIKHIWLWGIAQKCQELKHYLKNIKSILIRLELLKILWSKVDLQSDNLQKSEVDHKVLKTMVELSR